MIVYEVLLSKATRKQLVSLPPFIHNKIIEDTSGLATTPRLAGCKKTERVYEFLPDKSWRLQNYL